MSPSNAYFNAVHALTNNLPFAGSKPGLVDLHALHRRLGAPANTMDIVHVAGTNGKGSTCAKIAYGLQLAGKRVGLFTSPHISSFRERIRINGELISEEAFVKWHKEVTSFDIKPTFFEALTLMAFCYFASEKVDVVVLETGVGGLLDSTNICTPILSVITSIALDHQKYLGETLDEIAVHKGGIIKEGVPVVLGATAQREPILQRASEKKAPTIFGITSDGYFDDTNNEIASLALKQLSKTYPVSDEIICKAMHAMPRGRFEIIPQLVGMQRGFSVFPPYVVLDVAHNPNALESLYRAISLKLPSYPIRTVVALSEGHNPKGSLELIAKNSAKIHPISVENKRVYSVEALEKMEIGALEKIPSINKVIEEAGERGEILVFCGSFFLMPGVREALKFSDPRDPDRALGRFSNRLNFGK